MFGFFDKALTKEHMKLMYQNSMASNFLMRFDPSLAEKAARQVDSIQLIWQPGKKLPHGVADSLLSVNRELRRAYDQTPARYSKKFDDAFQPIMGWKAYFEDNKA